MKNPKCSQCTRASPVPTFHCGAFKETVVEGELVSCDSFCQALPEPDTKEEKVSELENALKVEREWTHALGEDSRNQQAMLNKIATLLGIENRSDTTDLPALLNSRLVQLETALDEADCTQREGGDTRHCDVGAPCWRCIAEKAEKKVEELERERKFYLYWHVSDAGLTCLLERAETAFDECNSDDPMVQRLRDNLADTIDNFKQALAQRDLARQELKELKEPTPQS